MVAAVVSTGADDPPFVAEASGGTAEFAPQVRQVAAAEVPQLDPLEVVPDALVRVQLRRVAWELLQVQPLGPAVGQEVFDRLAAVDRRAIPDHQQLAGDLPQQVLQEADHVQALEGVVLDQQQQPAVRGEAADGRQVVVGQRYPQEWGLAARGVGADRSRQQVEAGLVYPDDGPPFPLGFFLRTGQRSVSQRSIAASSLWLARRTGFWALQPAARRSFASRTTRSFSRRFARQPST